MAGTIGSSGGQTQTITDVTQIFDLLESNKSEVVQEVKDLIVENLHSTKENWLVYGLYEYWIQSGSARCSDILCGISREPHDKYLIEKMTDGIKSPVKDARRHALALLGQAVCKQTSWLCKIPQSTLFKELIKLLKTETDVVILLSGLLSMIMMLPIIPMAVVANHQDFFDVFGRLATWTNTTHNIPKEHLLHLQVGLYSLFHRLYAMFPCNFLSYLRHTFGPPDKRTVLLHTIMPMLEKVKMHPYLVTGTREAELHVSRWQSRDYHDIIAECSKISLDAYESSLPEEIPSGFTNVGPNCGMDELGATQTPATELSLEDVLKIRGSTLLSQSVDSAEINSLAQYIDELSNTAPATPLSIPATGGHPFSQTGLTIKTNLTPETAMEATPENTPVKDKDRSHFKLPLHSTPAAIQLFGPREELAIRHDSRPVPQTPPATPYSSVPSSPLPVTSTLTRRDSIFDTTNFRREPLMLQRLQKVQMEQQAAAQLQQNGEAPVASLNQNVTQPVEVTRKVAVVAPHSNFSTDGTTSNLESSHDSDKHVGTGGPLTPVATTSSTSLSGPSLIDPDLSLITLDEEPSGLDECSSVTTCTSGGLHMADHKSMVAFAKKVNRLRYHSHCVAGSDFNTSLAPSPGTSPSSSSSAGAFNARSRYMKRSLSCPDIKKPITDDKDGSAQKGSKLPEVSENSNGADDDTKEEPNKNEKEVGPKEPEHPYVHLFQKILPGVLSPLDSRTLPSPHRLLDLCLVKAAELQKPDGKYDEVAMLKGHIELLHGQLLFERHRREAHALRNRRLAGKCRKMVALEEQNVTMAQKIHNLEKEIASLKKEVTIQRNMGLATERGLLNAVEGLESKLESYRKDVSELTRYKAQLESKYSSLSEEFAALHKESDQKKADYFGLENEVKNCQKYIERNKELKTAYETRLKEILLLGELLRKYKEIMTPPSECRHLLQQLEDYRYTSEEEIRGLRSMLENVKSQQEAANGTIFDLMKRLEKREAIIELQRKDLQDKEQEHQLQMHALDSKYETIKTTNQRLEFEILSLQHQITVKSIVSTRPPRNRIVSASSPSNNGDVSPAGNSNHSDVDSAASAGGFQMSPDRNVCFFGSPQFDYPSDEMNNLQAVLDREPPEEEPTSSEPIILPGDHQRNSFLMTQTRHSKP